MKQYIIVFLFALLSFGKVMAQEHYAICKIVERNKVVNIEFSEEVKYLGIDYEKTIKQFGLKDKKFSDCFNAMSYLSSSWGWQVCGNPYVDKDGSVVCIMKHVVDNNIVNFIRYKELMEEYQNNENKNKTIKK